MALATSGTRHDKTSSSSTSSLLLLLLALALAPRLAGAVCDCGYVVDNAELGADPLLFTEYIETNFHQIKNVAADSDWRRQEFNVTAQAGRGEYGKSFFPSNIDIVNAAKAPASGGVSATGLEMRVGGKLVNNSVPTAEIDTARQDLFYGSYRAGMKMTDVSGTCAAFFWYFNDTQEIDMEFLSREFDRENNVYPVNLVIQSKQSVAAGFDAAGTDTFRKLNLTFDPSKGFHEYRFDFTADHVLFYADSQLLADMNGSAVPTTGGHLVLQHWSNGNPLWSGGPPTEDAVLSVSYVKAYFNSTDTKRQAAFAERCVAVKDPGSATCLVQDVVATNASAGGDFLGGNNPKSRGKDSAAIRPALPWSMAVTMMLLLAVLSGLL